MNANVVSAQSLMNFTFTRLTRYKISILILITFLCSVSTHLKAVVIKMKRELPSQSLVQLRIIFKRRRLKIVATQPYLKPFFMKKPKRPYYKPTHVCYLRFDHVKPPN